MSRLLRLTVLLLVLVAAMALPAAAHTELESTVPADGASVTDPPTEVVLDFTAALLPGSQPAVRVIDPAGDDLVAAPPTLEGGTVTVPLNLAVAEGVHTVDWAITAADGDDQTGSFTFTFAPPAAIATPPGAAPSPTMRPTPSVTADPTPAPTPTPTLTASPAEADVEGSTPEDEEAATDFVAGGLAAVGALVTLVAVFAVWSRRRSLLEDDDEG